MSGNLAATPVGHTVRAEAEVTKVEGKRIEFKVSGATSWKRSGTEPIGERLSSPLVQRASHGQGQA